MGTPPREIARKEGIPTVSRLTAGNLEAWLLRQPEPALVLFDTSWSAACRLEHGILVRLASHFAGRLRIGALDAAAHRGVSRRLGISWVPTLVLFESRQAVTRWEGARDAVELIREIEAALAGDKTSVVVDPAHRDRRRVAEVDRFMAPLRGRGSSR